MPRYNMNGNHLFPPNLAGFATPEDQTKDEIIAELRRRIEEMSTSGSSAASSVGDSSQSCAGGGGGGSSRRSRRRRNRNKGALMTTTTATPLQQQQEEAQYQQQQQHQQNRYQQNRSSNRNGAHSTYRSSASNATEEIPRPTERRKVPKLQLGLNLDLELELKARIDGNVTLCLLVEQEETPRPPSSIELPRPPGRLVEGATVSTELYHMRIGRLRLGRRWIERDVSASLTATAVAAVAAAGFALGLLVAAAARL
ncbi:hypothetical protein PpBr36_08957 [Pyricularia pennisetigena]|uniref:hypothetical protein n=1 Tax=Pyricularia pennisetigena TaxID=1578925 RepID=UPI00115070B2|nr:hypothetical protein PpBr36_08957 [Pyricularia pennisetigena]TLS24743.1 hypothetical protein PpBr36_08957 [Pyricularia pennisetigena]